jgi:two-component system, LuxR family, response regulator FixJ
LSPEPPPLAQANPDAAPDGPTVFLVDEDDAVRDALAMSLRAAGHPVVACASARQFLDAYRRGHPGCLVVDRDLPEGGAVELLWMLAVAQISLPAIITSRRLRSKPPVGGLPAGRILFLDKPFGIDELSRLIRSALATACGSQPGP